MSSVLHLREFISERLTAAAGEIFSEFEKTIVQYEEEIDRQRRLLDISWNPHVKLIRTELPQLHVDKEEQVPADQQLHDQDGNSNLDQESPEIKHEPEELCFTQEGALKEEADDAILAFTFQDDNGSEAEPNADPLSSHDSPVPENQDQETTIHRDPQTAGEEKKKKKKKKKKKEEESKKKRKKKRSDVTRKIETNMEKRERKKKKDKKKNGLKKTKKGISKKKKKLGHKGIEQEVPQQHVHEEELVLPELERNSSLDQEENNQQEELSIRREGEQFTTKEVADNLMLVSSFQKSDLSEAEANTDQLSSPENQNQDVNNHIDSETTTEMEKNTKKRLKRKRSCCCDEDNSSVSLLNRKVSGRIKADAKQHDGENTKTKKTQKARVRKVEKSVFCGKCGKHLYKKYLEIHMATHRGEKLHVCKTCGKFFPSSDKLSQHEELHAKGKPYPCETCGKVFTHMHDLRRHKKTHTAEKCYPCNTCGKVFFFRIHLWKHEQTHIIDKLHFCEVCGKSYLYKAILRSHRKSHTHFSCKICGKGYFSASSLSAHMRVHTGEKPFPCKLCGNRFHTICGLYSHKRIHNRQKV